jgi:hypothetical protein
VLTAAHRIVRDLSAAVPALIALLVLLGPNASAQTQYEVDAAQSIVDQIRPLVESGALPAARLAEAELNLADAKDHAIIQKGLFGGTQISALLDQEAERVVEAAERRIERQKSRIARIEQLVQEGILPRNDVSDALREVETRTQIHQMAQRQLELLNQMNALAALERQSFEATRFEKFEIKPLVERFIGLNQFNPADFKRLDQAFLKQFGVTLPVSAFGQTATHNALGFDHRGRIDIALQPDSPEGRFLLDLLRANQIPFYAIRSALPGVSTAPHIHVGPPSAPLLRGN